MLSVALGLVAALAALVAWAASGFMDARPPRAIRVLLTSGTCVPCWALRIEPNDPDGWFAFCSYRVTDGGYAFQSWPAREIKAVEVNTQGSAYGLADRLAGTNCAAKWSPEDTR